MDENLAAQNRELIESLGEACFTTIGEDGYPQTRAVFNLRCRHRFPSLVHLFQDHQKDLLLYFTTNTGSEKMRQLRANPAVCAFFCRPDQYHGVMLSGRAEIAADPVLKQAIWQPGWEIYYPQGPADPDYTILRLRPLRMKGWLGDHPFDVKLV